VWKKERVARLGYALTGVIAIKVKHDACR